MAFPLATRVGGRRLAELLGTWSGDRPSSADLLASVRALVRDGRLPPGTRLPAERELAEALQVSRTLVTAALDRLRADGVVDSKRGAGSWVRAGASPSRVSAAGGSVMSWAPGSTSEAMDFAYAAPSAPPELFTAYERARERLPPHLAGTGYAPSGLVELRERIAERLTQRGVVTGPEEIVITNGAQHALALSLRAHTAPGDRVLVEHPSYPNALQAIHAAHTRPVAVPLLDDGWDLDGIEAALRQAGPKLAYLVLDFHNPTGLRLDSEGRQRLAAALRRHRVRAVVDETHVELDLEGDLAHAPPPLASFDTEHALLVGSASKSFWGGMRLGWIRAPEDTARRLVATRPAFELGSPLLEQLVLAELLEAPEPGLRRRRVQLAGQRDVLVEAVRRELPGWRMRVPGGGLSLWCELDAPISSRLVLAAEQQGVRLVAGTRFATHGELEWWLRLPFEQPPDRIEEAVRRLARAASTVAERFDDVSGPQQVV